MGRCLRELAILTVLTLSAAACGGATSALNFKTSKEVRSTLYRYDGERSGAVWLRRHYRTVVGSAMDPSRAESQIAFHGLRTRFRDTVQMVRWFVSKAHLRPSTWGRGQES